LTELIAHHFGLVILPTQKSHQRRHPVFGWLKVWSVLQTDVDPETETDDDGDSDGDHKPENGVKDRISKALGGTATRAKERISKRVRSPIIIQNWQRLPAKVYDTACQVLSQLRSLGDKPLSW